MKRLAYIVASGVLAVVGFAPAVALAANDVTFSAETTITLAGGTIYVESGATVDSFVNNGANLSVTISSGSSITFRSDARSAFSVSPKVAEHVCETNSSKLTLTGTATAQTITVGLVQNSSCPAGGGGGGGGGGSSDSSSSSGTTAGSSSSSSGSTTVSTAPTGAAITIAGGASETSSAQVTLTLSAIGATQMQVSNSSTFSDGSGWVAYATSLPWTLPSGAGSKTVYVKYRSSGGVDSAAVSDSITLVASTTSTPVSTSTPVPAGVKELVKEAGTSAVYLLEGGRRRPFTKADIFLAHGFSWGAVRTVANLSSMPMGEPVDYPVVPGMLVKGSGPKVYLVEGGMRRWITSESVFLGLGYAWSAIRVMQEATLAGVPEGASISAAAAHSDGTLIKYATSPRVYLLEGGKKRWIPSAEIFTQRNLRWENIVTIPASFSYPDGADLTGSGTVLGVSTGPTAEEAFPEDLAPGDRSEVVRTLQSLLILRGYLAADVVPTGFYGAATRAAVQRFQQAHGITVTGTVGPKTRAVLNLHP